MADSVVGPGAEASSPLESQVKVKIHTLSNEEGDIFVARVVPPRGGERTPTDVCCVIDVSGSMGAAATTQGAGAEDSGLSLLDIVKHAVRTTIEVLQPEDRLGLIAYSSDARIVCPMVAMDEAGKARAKTALTSMTPGGQTNLWDGLKKGLDMVREAKGEDLGHLGSVLLLTDGCPNIVPPRGHLPMLKKYRDNFLTLPCSIHTFGFGYNLESKLLLDLAVEGNGLYSFIPDAGFVGTCFCNALANVLVTMTKNAVLSIEAADGTKITADDVLGASAETADWGVQVNLGALQFGQDKSIVFKVKDGEKFRPSVTLKYLHRKNPEPVQVTSEDDNDGKELMVQYARSLFVDTILNKCQDVQPVNCTKALTEHIEPLVNEIQSSLSKFNDPRLVTLCKDVSGQVTEAFSKDEYFSKWGKHYLPSLARSHQLEMCSNFKDPGLQHYGGKLFSSIQDIADDLFNALPPPTPSIQSYSYGGGYGGYGRSAPAAAAAPSAARAINMSSYNNASNPCFHGNCTVQMADGSAKLVASVRKGDRVAVPSAADGAEVVCVVCTACEAGVTDLVTLDGGLMVTPYHPLRTFSGAWVFPCSLAPSRPEPCEAVYSFVLAAGHIMSINGRDCVTLGHGFQQNTVAHPFFGSSKVIAELSAMAGWHSGLVSLRSGCLRRDPISGLACGFKIGCGAIGPVDASEIYASAADPVMASSVGESGSIRVSC